MDHIFPKLVYQKQPFGKFSMMRTAAAGVLIGSDDMVGLTCVLCVVKHQGKLGV